MALSWLAANYERFSFDKDRIFIIGHSAGAFMASLLALQPDVFLPANKPSFTIRGIIGVEGIYDLNQMLGDFPNYLQWVVSPAFNGGDEEFDYYSPTVIAKSIDNRSHAQYPSFLIVHAEKDELVKPTQSSAFAQALQEHWQPAERTELFVTNHPDGYHNSVVDRIENGFEIIAPTILAFINRLMS